LSHRIVFTLVLMLAACLLPAFAVAVALYTGTAPVNSQSDEERAGALRTALGQVVVKLSGDPGVLSRSDVAKAIGHADRYMQQYSYQRNASADPAQSAAHFLLVVQFDRSSVDALLRDLNLDGSVDFGVIPRADTAGATAAPVAAAAAPGSYHLWISGLRSAEDYARLIGALSGNEQVRALRVEAARGNGVQVKVETRGALQSLLDSLETTRLARRTSDARPPLEGIDALLDFEP
jgi:hypothetical protein